MPRSWHSSEMRSAGLPPLACAEQAARRLGAATDSLGSLLEQHLRALDASLMAGEPRILADHLQWERVRLRTVARDVDGASVRRALRDVLEPGLGPEAVARAESVWARADQLADGVVLEPSDTADVDSGPVQAYLDRILSADRDGALAVVMAVADQVEDVTEVFVNLLQPAQRELGRRWQEGLVSVAQEHFGTAVTQQSLAMLYPRLFRPGQGGRLLVAVAAGTDPHEVGLRIVVDVMESRGWRTVYLGSSVPPEDVVAELVTRDADMLAISVSVASQLGPVGHLIRAVRAEPRCAAVRVLVGGRLISVAPHLAEWLGADAWAADAKDVVAVGERAMAELRVGV